MDVIDYKNLPDSLEAEELEVYFNEFLRIYADKPKDIHALNQLYELAYRQWDTYENIAPEIASRLEEYIMSAINFNSYDITDIVISIVENLSLKNVFNYIIESKKEIVNPSIRKLIDEAEEEYADTIDDPYSDIDDWF
ncbi:MAG: hypothetical protein IJ192_12660 [Clostridia bacterium]|nr:hypothetical protein [Clostridia bacterium]